MRKHRHRARSFRILQEARPGRRALWREFCECGMNRKRVACCPEAECGPWTESVSETSIEQPPPGDA